jgi:DNA-binding transcriptional regulator GbsR (MarR family)
MSDKKETAVEFAVEKLEKFIPSGNQLIIHIILEQAKEMESKKQQKYDEMMGMLERAERTLREVYDCDTKEIEQLIKEAKEL